MKPASGNKSLKTFGWVSRLSKHSTLTIQEHTFFSNCVLDEGCTGMSWHQNEITCQKKLEVAGCMHHQGKKRHIPVMQSDHQRHFNKRGNIWVSRYLHYWHLRLFLCGQPCSNLFMTPQMLGSPDTWNLALSRPQTAWGREALMSVLHWKSHWWPANCT